MKEFMAQLEARLNALAQLAQMEFAGGSPAALLTVMEGEETTQNLIDLARFGALT